MALVSKQITVCNRDTFGKERVATTQRTFSIDGSYYQLDLCEEHATLFDRDLGRWTMVADEIDAPDVKTKSQFFTDERKREARRIAELRSKAADQAASRAFAERRREEIDMEEALAAESRARHTIPGAMKWRITNHAHERMNERGFTVHEVLETATNPQTSVRQEWRGPHIAVYQRGECRIVVDDVTKAIITVIDRADTLETRPALGKAL